MKRCIICEEEKVTHCIKGMPNQCYCKECAEVQFDSIDNLEDMNTKPELDSTDTTEDFIEND